MDAFNRVDPSFAERIMRMAEIGVETQSHVAKTTADAEATAVRVSAVMVAVIPAALIVLAVVALAVGLPWPVAIVAAIGPVLAGIAQVIAAARPRRRRNRDGKS